MENQRRQNKYTKTRDEKKTARAILSN